MTATIHNVPNLQKPRLPNPAVHPNKRRKCNFPKRYITFVLLVLVSVFTLYDVLPTVFDTKYVSSFTPREGRRISRRTLRLYQRQLHLHPLSSRAITAAFIFFIADICAQLLSAPRNHPCYGFRFDRLFRYSLYGLLVMGPFLYVWYEAMHAYGPADDLKGSLIKCVFEQLTLEPCCIILYIIYDALLCRRGFSSARTTLAAKFLPLWFKNAVFWLPANFANYYIGTPDLRVVFANLCSLFWNIYFSANVNTAPTPSSSDNKYLTLQTGQRLSTIKTNLPSNSA